MLSGRNFSFEALRATWACTLNIPTVDLAKQVVGVGNCSGRSVDKFAKFGLAPAPEVDAPRVAECCANLECRIVDTREVNRCNFFVLEMAKIWVNASVKKPKTLHHRGNGAFCVAGETLPLRSAMK